MAQSTSSAHDFVFEMPNGETLDLGSLSGKALLIVNTATECGFTGQIGGLQELHDRYGDKGLVVIGVPSNDFGGQEPRSDDEIAAFCEARFGASYIMTAKTHVKGAQAHPFYKWAVSELGVVARPYWNFHKYLISPEGGIAAWFSTPTKPMAPKVTRRIESLLANLPQDMAGITQD
ncbi:glutathione peroxidase [Roseibium sp. RKSG952]|uniref:glutathione peroxidase n=1 Tax=Roseibium sp. RKSG952 TaxID=2529384 RepID=UPI001AD8D907|nr:glutathione peroxidase [Roseibium sp. RKSG952]